MRVSQSLARHGAVYRPRFHGHVAAASERHRLSWLVIIYAKSRRPLTPDTRPPVSRGFMPVHVCSGVCVSHVPWLGCPW
ncbi:uncharacterized protein UV8b_08060 [Ustilaginoidea virens]|uniref:Uncharacterized protein n=1 Tax=Ustilaginoidea virens TaxID=1159556 RepID=A0A8E5HZ12_USTVR|nr:uncharacterized protein UV8b_08060 [Ustilaginoidea virens]QUC23819.1 hypothetical protein UV8b_08060 [Ustilaginoidea virens]